MCSQVCSKVSSSYYGGRTSDSIINGKKLGTMLGKKLQVRSESRTLKNSRLDSGRIDKRLIAELGSVIQKFSQTTFVENYNDAVIHISQLMLVVLWVVINGKTL